MFDVKPELSEASKTTNYMYFQALEKKYIKLAEEANENKQKFAQQASNTNESVIQ